MSRSKTIQIRVTEEEYAKLTSVAQSWGMTLAPWARHCLTRQLSKEELEKQTNAQAPTPTVIEDKTAPNPDWVDATPEQVQADKEALEKVMAPGKADQYMVQEPVPQPLTVLNGEKAERAEQIIEETEATFNPDHALSQQPKEPPEPTARVPQPVHEPPEVPPAFKEALGELERGLAVPFNPAKAIAQPTPQPPKPEVTAGTPQLPNPEEVKDPRERIYLSILKREGKARADMWLATNRPGKGIQI